MKLLTTIFLFTLSVSISAQDGELFTKAKEQQLSNIDKRITYLNELKSCLAGASDKSGLKKCREDHKAKVESLKNDNESWKEGMKSERKSKREARKKE